MPVAKKLYRVASPFVLHHNGRDESYSIGTDIFSEDHYAVKANPWAFRQIEVLGTVETATAAPGEVRATKIPKK